MAQTGGGPAPTPAGLQLGGLCGASCGHWCPDTAVDPELPLALLQANFPGAPRPRHVSHWGLAVSGFKHEVQTHL